MGSAKATVGNLRHRITIQKLDKTADGQGGFTEDWQDLISVWAEIKPTKAWERFQTEKIEMLVTHKATIRYIVPKVDNVDVPITSEMRITWMNQIFQIKGVQQDNLRRFWMILDLQQGEGS